MNKVRYRKQALRFQGEGIRARQKDPAALGFGQAEETRFGFRQWVMEPGLGFEKVGFDRGKLRRPELEGQVVIERAEFARAMGATCSRFQDKRIGFVRRSPDSSRKVHDGFLSPALKRDGPYRLLSDSSCKMGFSIRSTVIFCSTKEQRRWQNAKVRKWNAAGRYPPCNA